MRRVLSAETQEVLSNALTGPTISRVDLSALAVTSSFSWSKHMRRGRVARTIHLTVVRNCQPSARLARKWEEGSSLGDSID